MTRIKAASLVVLSQKQVIACVERPYSSADVCQAAGLSRATFDAWILRKYLPLPPGPGTGRERRFSANEAVLVAVAAHLTKARLSITAAARVVAFLSRGAGGVWPRVQHEAGWLLVTGLTLVAAGIPERMGVSSISGEAALIRWETLLELEPYIYPDKSEPSPGVETDSLVVVIANVSEIARRTLKRLADPAAAPAAVVPDTDVPRIKK